MGWVCTCGIRKGKVIRFSNPFLVAFSFAFDLLFLVPILLPTLLTKYNKKISVTRKTNGTVD